MRLSNLGKQDFWAGVVISERGEILTTSEGLWNAPVLDVQLPDGTQGQACLIGGDDRIGLALLEPAIEAPFNHGYLSSSSDRVAIGDDLSLFQYSQFTGRLDERTVQVHDYTPANGGHGYMRVDVAEGTAGEGAVLMNEHDELQGIRMPTLWLLRHQFGNPGESWAIDTTDVANTALPLLRSGRMHIEPPWSGGIDWSPSYVPIILIGEITVDGAPAPVGSIVHARVIEEGLPDYWTSDAIYEPGVLITDVRPPSNSSVGATVEFWMDCRRSPTTVTLEGPLPNIVRDLDIAF